MVTFNLSPLDCTQTIASAHACSCPDTFAPRYVCAQTRLCPHTFCTQTRLCPDYLVPTHVRAQAHLCLDIFVPIHFILFWALMCLGTNVCGYSHVVTVAWVNVAEPFA